MTERMSDERLAQLSLAADSPPPFDDFATRIVHDALQELVAEVKRPGARRSGCLRLSPTRSAPSVRALTVRGNCAISWARSRST